MDCPHKAGKDDGGGFDPGKSGALQGEIMTEIRFYHLLTRSVDQALPDIVQKALSAGHRILVRTRDEDEAERLNAYLWTYRPDAFIPHGSRKDGHAADQPVYLSARNDNSNGATVLIVASGLQPDSFEGFTLCCDLFDGRDEAQVLAARERWKSYKDSGHALAYWQQTEKGWEQKA
jgi:DNA polymerase-3 subunit chi